MKKKIAICLTTLFVTLSAFIAVKTSEKESKSALLLANAEALTTDEASSVWPSIWRLSNQGTTCYTSGLEGYMFKCQKESAYTFLISNCNEGQERCVTRISLQGR
jgi:hypothetical protein